jgi:NifU-like protein involved in Fe-S cluster formation
MRAAGLGIAACARRLGVANPMNRNHNDDTRYSPEVLRRFKELSGVGQVPPGPGVIHGVAGDREQGAEIELVARVSDGRVAEARFLAFGCPHLMAAASWLTEAMVGFDREQLGAWDWQEAARELEIPPAKYARLLTLQDAARDLARNWSNARLSTV